MGVTAATVVAEPRRGSASKQAPIRNANAMALAALVIVCTLPLARTPRHCVAMRMRTMAEAIAACDVASEGNTAATDSPNTMAMAATLAQVEIQSLHPTANPG